MPFYLIQATAVLASPLNGQFYVIGNPSEVLGGSRTIAPRFTLDSTSPPGTGSGGGTNPRHDRRRATHNEVERRRRDNINAWIMKLGRLIPPGTLKAIWRKAGQVVSELDSRSKSCGFDSRLIQNTTWKWATFKAMPGLIPAPNSGLFMEKYENVGSKMGQTDTKNFVRKSPRRLILILSHSFAPLSLLAVFHIFKPKLRPPLHSDHLSIRPQF
jgi:hypothetical protein